MLSLKRNTVLSGLQFSLNIFYFLTYGGGGVFYFVFVRDLFRSGSAFQFSVVLEECLMVAPAGFYNRSGLFGLVWFLFNHWRSYRAAGIRPLSLRLGRSLY